MSESYGSYLGEGVRNVRETYGLGLSDTLDTPDARHAHAQRQGSIVSNRAPRSKLGYLEQAKRLALAKGIAPGVHHVVVKHDDRCQVLNGGNTCNCEVNSHSARGNGTTVKYCWHP